MMIETTDINRAYKDQVRVMSATTCTDDAWI